MYFIIFFLIFVLYIYRSYVLIKNGLSAKQISKLPMYIKEEVELIHEGEIDEKALGKHFGLLGIIQSFYPLGFAFGFHLRLSWLLFVSIIFYGLTILANEIFLRRAVMYTSRFNKNRKK